MREKYAASNCPEGLCKDLGKLERALGLGKQEFLEEISSYTSEEKMVLARQITERTTRLIRAALNYEKHNESQVELIADYRSEGELDCELEHMYERNQLAFDLMSHTLAAHNYLDKLVEEIARGDRPNQRD
ncbi:hypothetical protein H8D36_03840 [archaeon]|nr:hypothetical protein [archaeon]